MRNPFKLWSDFRRLEERVVSIENRKEMLLTVIEEKLKARDTLNNKTTRGLCSWIVPSRGEKYVQLLADELIKKHGKKGK